MKTLAPRTSTLLGQVLDRLPGGRHVVVCTAGGLVHTLAPGADRREADQLAALGANLLSLSSPLARWGYGRTRRLAARAATGGWLLVFPIGAELRAVLVVDADTPLAHARSVLDRLVQDFPAEALAQGGRP